MTDRILDQVTQRAPEQVRLDFGDEPLAGLHLDPLAERHELLDHRVGKRLEVDRADRLGGATGAGEGQGLLQHRAPFPRASRSPGRARPRAPSISTRMRRQASGVRMSWPIAPSIRSFSSSIAETRSLIALKATSARRTSAGPRSSTCGASPRPSKLFAAAVSSLSGRPSRIAISTTAAEQDEVDEQGRGGELQPDPGIGPGREQAPVQPVAVGKLDREAQRLESALALARRSSATAARRIAGLRARRRRQRRR